MIEVAFTVRSKHVRLAAAEGELGDLLRGYFPEPILGDVAVEVVFDVPVVSGRQGDLDNLCKMLLDSLNGIAWVDDGQVVELHASVNRRAPAGVVRLAVIAVGPASGFTCARCGEVLRVPPAVARRRKFCSRACYDIAQRKAWCTRCGSKCKPGAKRCRTCWIEDLARGEIDRRGQEHLHAG